MPSWKAGWLVRMLVCHLPSWWSSLLAAVLPTSASTCSTILRDWLSLDPETAKLIYRSQHFMAHSYLPDRYQKLSFLPLCLLFIVPVTKPGLGKPHLSTKPLHNSDTHKADNAHFKYCGLFSVCGTGSWGNVCEVYGRNGFPITMRLFRHGVA